MVASFETFAAMKRLEYTNSFSAGMSTCSFSGATLRQQSKSCLINRPCFRITSFVTAPLLTLLLAAASLSFLNAAGIILTKKTPSEAEVYWHPIEFSTLENYSSSIVIQSTGARQSTTIPRYTIGAVLEFPSLTLATLIDEEDWNKLKSKKDDLAMHSMLCKEATPILSKVVSEIDQVLTKHQDGFLLVRGQWINKHEWAAKIAADAKALQAAKGPEITVGKMTYRDVKVIKVVADRISIMYEGGIASIKIGELSEDQLLKLKAGFAAMFPDELEKKPAISQQGITDAPSIPTQVISQQKKPLFYGENIRFLIPEYLAFSRTRFVEGKGKYCFHVFKSTSENIFQVVLSEYDDFDAFLRSYPDDSPVHAEFKNNPKFIALQKSFYNKSSDREWVHIERPNGGSCFLDSFLINPTSYKLINVRHTVRLGSDAQSDLLTKIKEYVELRVTWSDDVPVGWNDSKLELLNIVPAEHKKLVTQMPLGKRVSQMQNCFGVGRSDPQPSPFIKSLASHTIYERLPKPFECFQCVDLYSRTGSDICEEVSLGAVSALPIPPNVSIEILKRTIGSEYQWKTHPKSNLQFTFLIGVSGSGLEVAAIVDNRTGSINIYSTESLRELIEKKKADK